MTIAQPVATRLWFLAPEGVANAGRQGRTALADVAETKRLDADDPAAAGAARATPDLCGPQQPQGARSTPQHGDDEVVEPDGEDPSCCCKTPEVRATGWVKSVSSPSP